MIITALAIAFNWDAYYQETVLKYFPSLSIDDNSYVKKELSEFRNQDSNSRRIQKNRRDATPTDNSSFSNSSSLPHLGKMPEFKGMESWINSPPLSSQDLLGKVVLIDFWTYSCINCIRTLPYLKRWYEMYKDKGFVVIGVHTPEFAFEKDQSNVAAAVARFHIPYPVVLDNEYQTWQAFNNYYWPAHFLVDQRGRIRMEHFGEGAYLETENAIRNLLGLAPLSKELEDTTKEKMTKRVISPETYLGIQRAEHYVKGMQIKQNQVKEYLGSEPLEDNQVGLKGKWFIGPQNITSYEDGSELELNFIATKVYLVLGGESLEPIEVLLDGKPLPKRYYTEDMNRKGQLYVKEPRKYDILDLKGDYGQHLLTLRVPSGISAYAFTFGEE